jgi:uncharacterized membrane protein YgcG
LGLAGLLALAACGTQDRSGPATDNGADTGSASQRPTKAPSPVASPGTRIPPLATPTIVVPNLHVVDAALVGPASVLADRLVLAPTATVRVAADSRATAATSLVVGDYVVSGVGASVPFLRKITAVSAAPTSVALLTSQAALTDVVQQGQLEATLDYADSNRPSVIPFTGCSGGLFNNGCFNLTAKQLNGDQFTAHVVDGHLDFNPKLDLGVSIGFFTLNEFHAILGGSFDAKIDVAASILARAPVTGATNETTVASIPASFWQTIGPVPVEETVVLSLILGCKTTWDESISLEAGVQASAALQFGVRYQHGAFSPVASQSFQSQLLGPSFSADTSVESKCYVRPRIDILFYDTLGPGFFVDPYVDAKLDFTTAKWTESIGFEGYAAGSIDLLGHNLGEIQLKLWDTTFQTASGDVPGGSGSSSSGSSSSSSGSTSGSGSGSGGSSGSSGAPNSPCGAGDNNLSDNGTCGTDNRVYYCYQGVWHLKDDCVAKHEVCQVRPGIADQCTCPGTVCGVRCCPASDWCGTGNICCSGPGPGCRNF